ncbi:MAG: hypothetical protein FJ279_34915, partial [Planctomycetes bacterium]|nr:hypothetical protein [Planctomycetota bacterium]
AYDSSQWRRYILSARSHNTVMVDGLEQNRRSQPRDTFVVKKPLEGQYALGEDFDYAWGVYNEGYGPKNDRSVTHTRKVLFVKPEFWLVTDFLTASDDREHRYESLFHFDTDLAEVDAATKSVATRIPGGPNLALVPLATDGLDVSIVKGQEKPVVQGWLPAGGFKCRPIAAPIFTKSGKGTTVMAYVFYPMQPPAGSKPAGGFALPIVKAEPLPVTSNGAPVSDAFAAKLSFRDGRVSFFVQSLTPGRTLAFSDFTTDGEAAFVELDPHGKPTRTIVVNGSFARLRP